MFSKALEFHTMRKGGQQKHAYIMIYHEKVYPNLNYLKPRASIKTTQACTDAREFQVIWTPLETPQSCAVHASSHRSCRLESGCYPRSDTGGIYSANWFCRFLK